MGKKVAIGLSGGIDSSAAAYLLKEEGYEPIGFTLKFFPLDNRCCDLDSLYQARRLCDKLKIPHYTLDAGDNFQRQIIDNFLSSYLNGLTPNPCTFCNRLIKFGFFLDKLKALNIEYLATGHYAAIVKKGERYFLKEARDKVKSQEYFLAMLKPQVLPKLIFPLSDYTKSQVYELARDKKILFKERKESQDVCFVTRGSYSDFIRDNITDHHKYSGDIKHVEGKILGKHKGIYNFTYGQRQGLGVGWREPLYVVSINPETKDVIVGERKFLSQDSFYLNSPNWFIEENELLSYNKENTPLKVKVRYNSPSHPCYLEANSGRIKVKLLNPLESIAPGQVAVFYNQDIVLGAGLIDKL